jgi:hypothetical protein
MSLSRSFGLLERIQESYPFRPAGLLAPPMPLQPQQAKPTAARPANEPPGRPEGEGWTFDPISGLWSRPVGPWEAPPQAPKVRWPDADDNYPGALRSTLYLIN